MSLEEDKNHWLMTVILLPFITVWMYLVGIYFQAGYFYYYNIPTTFAETLPTYLLFGWVPIIGYGLGAIISLFLTLELLSRLLTTNKTIRSFAITLLTYLGMLLMILVPHHYGFIPDSFVTYEFIVLGLIIVVHIVQKIFWNHVFTKDSMAFYLSRNFGVLIILLILLQGSLSFVFKKGYEMAQNQTSYQVFGANPEYAVIFIGSKYLLAMPVDTDARTIREELKVVNLDALDVPLVKRTFGTGTLTITPTVLPSGS